MKMSQSRTDTALLAAAARSILACPDEVQLVVDGVDDILAGLETGEPGGTGGRAAALGLVDVEGCPVRSCRCEAPRLGNEWFRPVSQRWASATYTNKTPSQSR